MHLAFEAEFSASVKVVQAFEELGPKHGAQHPNREEELWVSVNPASAVFGEAASRDDTVEVRVEIELLAPGVKYGGEADVGPQVTGIGGYLLEGGGGSPEQQVVNLTLVV